MKKIVFSAIAALFCVSAFAQDRGTFVGTVVDPTGAAVPNARVQVLRYQMVQGTRRLNPSGGGDQSDDTGAYRIYGLPPGDYYIAAVSDALATDWQNPEFLTALSRAAQRIRISEGEKKTQALRTQARANEAFSARKP